MEQVEDKKIEYTPELVMQMFAETDKQVKETQQSIRDYKQATQKSIQELSEKIAHTNMVVERTSNIVERTSNSIQELRNELGGVGKSNGAVAEEMIFNSLERDMSFAGVNFDDILQNMGYKKKKLGIEDEYDIVLRNGNTLAIIETKYKVRDIDVSKLVGKKLDNFRILYPEYNNYKILLGIGGMAFEKEAINEAKNNGVGIIKIAGDKVEFYTEGIKTYC